MGIRFLHLADTHLGARHASGSTAPFAENLRLALAPAVRGEVDVVLHAGDLFHRSRPPSRWLAEGAAALLEAADAGTEVVLLPGNHERSLLPGTLLLAHPRLHLLDRPRTVRLALAGIDVAVVGFPFVRGNVRARFESLLREAGWPAARAEVNVLLCHQALDGARVGPVSYPDLLTAPRGLGRISRPIALLLVVIDRLRKVDSSSRLALDRDLSAETHCRGARARATPVEAPCASP